MLHKISPDRFIRRIGAVLLLSVLLLIQTSVMAQDAFSYLWVGTYTKTTSEGVYLYRFNEKDASTELVAIAKNVVNPSYLTIAGNGRKLYTVSEHQGDRQGSVTAFRYEPGADAIQLVNEVEIKGQGPCFISIDKSGSKILTANYGSGSLSVLDVQPEGELGALKQSIVHSGHSKHPERQSAPHAHTTMFSPDGRFVWATDLGTDEVTIYPFSSENGLDDKNAGVFRSPTGSGPRHIAFHPKLSIAYIINELSGTISVVQYKDKDVKLIRTVAIVDNPKTTDVGSADIHLSPDGKFCYATTRGNLDIITIFKVDANGGLLKIGVQSTMGKKPRNFTLDPTGKFLLVANQDSNSIIIFRRDANTGLLKHTGKSIEVSMPSCLKMLPISQ